MSESKKRRNGSLVWAVVAMLPVLYVLSIGPVIWCLDHGAIPRSAEPALLTFYAPLREVYRTPGLLQKPIDAYIMWWHPRPRTIGRLK